MLHFSRSDIASMIAHVIDSLPQEGCGLIAGDPSSTVVSKWFPATNLERSAKLYSVDPMDFLKADRQAQASGLEVVGVFHSHTKSDAYPSPTDIELAPDPNWHYVIISLRHSDPVIRSFRIVQGEVEEETIEVDQ